MGEKVIMIHNNHDRYFETTFKDKENAIDYLNEILPDEIKKNITLENIKLEDKSYIDNKLNRYLSDIVYSGKYNKTGAEVKICFIFEHKSYPGKYHHLQLLQYMLNAWYSDIEQTESKEKVQFRVIIPIIVYHGKDTWKVVTFEDYFESLDTELKRFIPSFDYILTDFSKYTNHELQFKYFKRGILKMAVFLLKNIFYLDEMEKWLEKFVNLAIITDKDEGVIMKFIESSLLYLFSNIENSDSARKREIKNIFEKAGIHMTIKEQFILDTKEIGAKENAFKIARNMISDHVSIETISKYTELSVEEISRLK